MPTTPPPKDCSSSCSRTDNGGEFKGKFQRELDKLGITHEHTSPDTPQYNGVTERAFGLLREENIALLEDLDDVITAKRERSWARAIQFACDVTNKSVTTSTEGKKSAYELWNGKAPTPDHLQPFGMIGYARGHSMAPKGEKCALMEIPLNFLSGTTCILLVATRRIVERQDV